MEGSFWYVLLLDKYFAIFKLFINFYANEVIWFENPNTWKREKEKWPSHRISSRLQGEIDGIKMVGQGRSILSKKERGTEVLRNTSFETKNGWVATIKLPKKVVKVIKVGRGHFKGKRNCQKLLICLGIVSWRERMEERW